MPDAVQLLAVLCQGIQRAQAVHFLSDSCGHIRHMRPPQSIHIKTRQSQLLILIHACLAIACIMSMDSCFATCNNVCSVVCRWAHE